MTATTAHDASEHAMPMPDGTKLFYRAWEPNEPAKRALVLFHRGHEHSGRFEDVVEQLGLKQTAVFAWDARGHGRSPGERGYAPSFATTAHDIEHFVKGLSSAHGYAIEDMIVLGHSVGAVSVVAWIHDYAPPIRGLILVTPAFRVRLYLPWAIPGLRLLERLRGQRRTFIKSYVKSQMLTHDPEQAERYDNDPLITRAIAVNILLELHDTATRLIDDAPAIHTPTLLLSAGSDWVVKHEAQRRFFDRLGASLKRIRTFSDMYHDLLHERERTPVLEEIRSFLSDLDREPRPDPRAHDADRYGVTAAEHDRLNQPLPVISPKRWWFEGQKLTLRTLGNLSEGIRLGWQTGFDSGQSLDYVYNNQPAGRLGPIGRFVDRRYLDAPGWRGIRERRDLLQHALRQAIEASAVTDRPVRIVDIAAGGGRYVLETVASLQHPQVEVVLRDHKPANVEAARHLAAQLGLENIRCEPGDAFHADDLASLTPAPDIAIASGLYELFPGNAPVLASLRGLAAAMSAGGQLIYTGQPWHPQLEMIARVLPNRDGKPWVMRRRTQYELDALTYAAGFEKTRQAIDLQGIFTVSTARKR